MMAAPRAIRWGPSIFKVGSWIVERGSWKKAAVHGLRSTIYDRFLGDCSEGVTPVPIPKTEVKPLSPDGTARASGWESRTLPE